MRAPTRRGAMLAAATVVVLLGGCKDRGKWLQGEWLLVDEGKPGVCHVFTPKTFIVYVGAECKGTHDPLLSGKWQIKGDGKFAVQRGNDDIAHMVIVTERSAEKIVASGAITGTLHRIGEGGSAALVAKLERDGVITLRALPPELGCQQLSTAIDKVKAMPKEKSPRMIRSRDEGLDFHSATSAGDPTVQKIIYAINQDQLDWISVHFTEAAFSGSGPEGRLEAVLGKAQRSAATGTGATRQLISMWKTYCADLSGAKNKQIDVTLFTTAGKKEAYYYVSDGVIAGVWDEVQAAAADTSQQKTDEERAEEERAAKEEMGEPVPAAKPAPAPAPAPVATKPAPAPAPVATKPAPAPVATKPVPVKSAPLPPVAKPGAKATKSGGGLAVPGSDDEI